MKENIAQKYKDKLELIESWWHGENDRPLISFIPLEDDKRRKLTAKLNSLWPTTNSEPDYESLATTYRHTVADINCGDALPVVPHLFGERGTAMTMAHYLGGNVMFGDDTVWVKPVIKQWDDFEIKFDENNPWWKRSLNLLEKSCRALRKHCFVSLPDFGDAMTCLSLLRGTENLLFDLLDNKDAVLRARDEFIKAWPLYHKACWQIYSRYYPGDFSWLTWAPGKTYAVQCDFSTMISPEQFKEFVVPELEALSQYLDYMIWHLDGPEEIRHLDILLDMPFIKAIQWVPGAGHPSTGHWLELLAKIQSKGKSICCYTGSIEETQLLQKELSPKGLMITAVLTTSRLR
jgi:5-methyltetrahydrofolate--homocysteine methyltransferase